MPPTLGPAGNRGTFGLVFLDPPYGKGLAERALASAAAGAMARARRHCGHRGAQGRRHRPPRGFHALEARAGAIRRCCSHAIQASAPEPPACQSPHAHPKSTDPTDRPVIIWFRDDLRLADNRALLQPPRQVPVLAVYVFDQDSPGIRPLGGASRWWLHSQSRRARGRSGQARRPVAHLSWRCRCAPAEARASRQCRGRVLEPPLRRRRARGRQGREIHAARPGIKAESFNDHLCSSRGRSRPRPASLQGVHAVLARRSRAGRPAATLGRPKRLGAAEPPPHPNPSRSKSSRLLPTKPDWAGGLRETWTPGEAGARKQLSQFIAKRLRRLLPPAAIGPISPHVAACHRICAFGEISPRQIWHAARARRAKTAAPRTATSRNSCPRLGWREFSYHLLFHNPDLATANFDRRFDAFPWAKDDKALHAWQRGRTGYPIVDAGMRELWQTGVMHNRVRMIAASFLIKHLLIDWRQGEAWFWDTLVDADPANNAGELAMGRRLRRRCRALLPHLQSDAAGREVRPRGRPMSAAGCRNWRGSLHKHIHQPWDAPAALLKRRRNPRRDYPHPIVDLDEAAPRACRFRQDQALTR